MWRKRGSLCVSVSSVSSVVNVVDFWPVVSQLRESLTRVFRDLHEIRRNYIDMQMLLCQSHIQSCFHLFLFHFVFVFVFFFFLLLLLLILLRKEKRGGSSEDAEIVDEHEAKVVRNGEVSAHVLAELAVSGVAGAVKRRH